MVVVSDGLADHHAHHHQWLQPHAQAQGSDDNVHWLSVAQIAHHVHAHPIVQFQPALHALPTLAIVQVQLIVFLTNILYQFGLRVIQELITKLL